MEFDKLFKGFNKRRMNVPGKWFDQLIELLAIHFDELFATGQVSSQAELARLGKVTRARLTQIMNLLLLAPVIQEQILEMPRIETGRAPITKRELRVISQMPNWREQRRSWGRIVD